MHDKLIFSDMDGCLTRSRTPATPEMIDMIKRIMVSHEFVVISGGGIDLLEKQIGCFFSDSEKPIHLLPQNGCYYYLRSKRGLELVYKEELDHKDVLAVNKAVGVLTTRFSISPVTSVKDMLEHRGALINFSATGRSAPLEVKEAFDPDRSIRREWLSVAQFLLPNLEIRIGGTTSLDFTRKGRHKGYGITKFLDYHDCSSGTCIFFGDAIFRGGNDFEATQVISKCISVSNPEGCLKLLSRWTENSF